MIRAALALPCLAAMALLGCHDPAPPRPEPRQPCGLDDVLARRRSVRTFSSEPVEPQKLARLLWAAQGLRDSSGHRTAPSAGALYPLELYAVEPAGVFHYRPDLSPTNTSLVRVREGDRRGELAAAALGQAAISGAAVDLVFTGVLGRTRAKYGDRAERYVLLEAGHAAQNVLLEATALGLASVPIGAFDDEAVARVVGAPPGEEAIYVIALGQPQP